MRAGGDVREGERWSVFSSPIGELLLVGERAGLTAVYFGLDTPSTGVRDDGAFAEVARQLAAYFRGELTDFSLPLAPHGTPFQQRVWAALTRIPYGTTTTYGQVATELGDPRAVRAVDLANGRNPIPIIIPCHRVIGANGGLTGYGGGIERKQWLLALEGGALPLG